MKKKIFYLTFVLLIISFFWIQNRSFHNIKNKQFITVWKTLENKSYLIINEHRYYGITKPSNNYIETTNDNLIIIILDPINNYYYLLNGADKYIVTNLNNIKIYNYNDDKLFYDTFFINNHIKRGYTLIQIDLKENLFVIK